MALSPKQVAQLAKEQERINKLQEEFYAAQEAGDKKAVKEQARLLKLANGRLDKLGSANQEVDKYYNTLKKQLDVSGEITKATQDRSTLLAESNALSQLEAQVGTKSARQTELQRIQEPFQRVAFLTQQKQLGPLDQIRPLYSNQNLL